MHSLMTETFRINNRRYLGNKYKLREFIRGVVDSECRNWEVFADIFAGTGAVASAFTDRTVVTNDILYSNYLCNVAWFGCEPYREEVISEFVQRYNSISCSEENYMTENFADTYFQRSDCAKIGYIREDIEKSFQNRTISERERALLITALLYAMDRIANTCGHYDAYRKNASFERTLELQLPLANVENNLDNQCFHADANELVTRIQADLVYLDPPYNSRQYCDAYHLLENVACWQKPEVFGVARKMDRKHLKSRYCTQSATEAFRDLVQKKFEQNIYYFHTII
ncbi:MAG: DNA adenine methylase [Planctomycetia bacterium]|nr:DNA adenine methylase [Planctomycetia bacterium]